MNKLSIDLEIEEYEHIALLSAKEQLVIEHALHAKERAYAPYSKFKVGAALTLDNGQIVEGNNQENLSYPSGLCAERVAFFTAAARFPKAHIVRMAVTADSDEFEVTQPVSPCGACRQVMLEYELNQSSPIDILLHSPKGKVYKIKGVTQLLPLFFNEQGLRSH